MAETSFEELLTQINQLPLVEQQKIHSMLSEKLSGATALKADRRVPPLVPNPDFSLALKWLREHQREYAGQWVALDGERLIAAGRSAREVYAAADAAGVALPLVTRVDDPDAPPFAGV